MRRPNILLVEDNLLNIKLVSILFSQNDLILEVAENGMEAIEKLKARHYDIILMDIEMPVMNGYEATRVIRQELKNNIPIIAMTAHAQAGEREKCLQIGMNDYLGKPVDEALLLRAIYNLTREFVTAGDEAVTAISDRSSLGAGKVCNLDYLIQSTRGNTSIMNSIIQVFLEETPVVLSALYDAIEKINYPAISDIAHKLRTSFSILGITMLEPVFDEMQYLGSNITGIKKIEILNQQVNRVFKQAMEEMNEDCQTLVA